MSKLAKLFSHLIMALSLSAMLTAPQMAYSKTLEEQPSALAMTGDLLIARPVLLALTAVGTVAYVVSLPFSLAGGNAQQAGETLVVGPAKATFVRCLGCTHSGYKKSTVETNQ